MRGDRHGHYALLGIDEHASVEVIKQAYRRLVKQCHPDIGKAQDGGLQFRRLTEAYTILSDPDARKAYNSREQETAAPPEQQADEQILEPLRCGDCGKYTAQARRLVFWRVTSFLFGTHRSPIQKIYCQLCAARESWKSTIWTALLGWWGVPWGPIWAATYGAGNALGGKRDSSDDESLLWHNAVAFASRGEGSIAIGISNILRKSENNSIAQRSAEIIRFFGEQGFDTSTSLKDVWKRSVGGTAVLFAIAFAAPGALFAWGLTSGAFGTASSPSLSSTPYVPAFEAVSNAPSEEIIQPSVTATEVPKPVPTCASKPGNGKILTDLREPEDAGHVLIIDNGTAGDAIVKVRDAQTDQTVASYFIRQGQQASLEHIPDGTYKFQYAFGTLGVDCESFSQLDSAGEFPGSETFTTTYETTFDGRTVGTSSLSYTLYAKPGGNVHPSTISAEQFNR